MKFACTQENLAQGLSLVSRITGKHVNLPVLENVLLKTEGGALKLSTTNLEMAMSAVVRGKVDAEGEYTVPAKLFLDFVSLLPSGKVEISFVEDGLEVRSGSQETTLKGMSASEFPLLPQVVRDKECVIPEEALKGALSRVAFAASSSESRPELTGVVCVLSESTKTLVLAATDSYRLAEAEIPLQEMVGDASLIVPARALAELSRILTSYSDSMGETAGVRWSFTENQLVATLGSAQLVTRLIEGSFPPYKEIIPTEFKTEAVLSRTELQKAVRAASLFARQGLFDVHFSLHPEDGTCLIASADQGTGKTKTSLQGKVEGEPVEVTLNFRYVSDG
ncbi:MAG: DNA polymerase III subunit beta, partial [bacterium]|nr:DNA polymerase III subunit beta [bacterium]